ncbi:hypothetical protein [Streptacidiphilus albus]|uniref:hypothetical protein n=1 Tax=Streptacidiphilus albus TaxID=105425 RepID=UPI000AB297C9
MDTLTEDLDDPAASSGTTGYGSRAQAQIAALGELIEATAQAAPEELRTELRAATKMFACAQRSQTRAEHAAAADLRAAARDLIHAGNGKDGSAAATLLAALLWAAVLAGRWHEARGHAQQTAAAPKPSSISRSPTTKPPPCPSPPTSGTASPSTPPASWPTPTGPPWPPSSPKPQATNPATSSTKPPPAANSTPPANPPASSSPESNTPPATRHPTPAQRQPASAPPP